MTLLQTEDLDTKQYAASILRYQSQQAPAQPGVVNTGDFLVSQRAAGASMSVDIAAGGAWVQGGSVARQGLYHQVNDATVSQTVAPADATNPRVDQVILAVNDSSVIGNSDIAQLLVVAGTPTAGATLDNRTGANSLAAYPSFLRVADVLVPNGSASVANANIRDRRPWARGFFRVVGRPPGGQTTYTTLAPLDSATYKTRIEVPDATHFFRVQFDCGWGWSGAALGAEPAYDLWVDSGGLGQARIQHLDSGSGNRGFDGTWIVGLSGGSHTIEPAWQATGGATLYMGTSSLLIEEIVRPNTGNNPAGYG